MKLLFTADIHIKLGQKNIPIDWAKKRYLKLFDLLEEKQSLADIVVIGGDIFDKLPSMDELELYFLMISKFNKPTYIYSGNHEAIKRNTTFFSNLIGVSNKVNSNVKVLDDFYEIDGIDFIPYNKLKEYDPRDIDFHNNILCTHVRGEIPPHVKPEVPLEIFERWKVVLAGDLHSYENSQRNILYPGSPLTTSFHRNKVDTGIIILDTDTLLHEWIKLDIPQLIRKTIKAGDPMPVTEYDYTIYEVEGDITELSSIENQELLDKKVVKRSIDTTLILDPGMSMIEELEEYLRYVLELKEDNINNVLKEYSLHSAKVEQHD